jgi:hypothetical protein
MSAKKTIHLIASLLLFLDEDKAAGTLFGIIELPFEVVEVFLGVGGGCSEDAGFHVLFAGEGGVEWGFAAGTIC